jgi:hypothetical protein
MQPEAFQLRNFTARTREVGPFFPRAGSAPVSARAACVGALPLLKLLKLLRFEAVFARHPLRHLLRLRRLGVGTSDMSCFSYLNYIWPG